MPLPLFDVTGTIHELVGSFVDEPSATLTFTPNFTGPVLWSGQLYWVKVVQVSVTSDGHVEPLQLLANDDGLNVVNIRWRVDVHIDGVMNQRWWFHAPADGQSVNLASVARAPGLAAVEIPGLTSQALVVLLQDDDSDVRAQLDDLYTEGGAGPGGGIVDIIEDTTPQLGGDLDLNGHTVGTATTADLTKLHGTLATAAELTYSQGVTSALQTQLNAKASTTFAAAAYARGNHTGVQPSSTISDLTEVVQDAVAAFLTQGTNVTLTYNDAANTLTVSAAGGGSEGGGGLDAEAVRDAIGIAMSGAGLISVTVNDAADTITITTTATANDTDANLKARGNHTGVQAASTISDFNAVTDARIPTMVHAATTKTSATNDDELLLLDSAASYGSKKLKISDFINTIKGYIDSVSTTFTNKRIVPREATVPSAAAPAINTNIVDIFGLTAQAVNITSMTTNLTGTPSGSEQLWIYIIGTAARTISWGASFENGAATLPTTTVTTQRLDVGLVWNPSTSKWRCMCTASA